MERRFSPVFLLLFACSSATSAPSSNATSTASTAAATSTEPWTDTEMQALVAARCASSDCHGGAQRPTYGNISEDAMRADTSALFEVQRGRMPRGSSLTAAEKEIFVTFYE